MGEWAREAGREGADRGPKSNAGATKVHWWAPLNPNHWSDLPSNEGGGQGEAWKRCAGSRFGEAGVPAPFGGATREQCRGNFQTLTTGLIW